jgi:hypothetical protein
MREASRKSLVVERGEADGAALVGKIAHIVAAYLIGDLTEVST